MKRLKPYEEEELFRNQVVDINVATGKPTKYMHELQVWSGHHGEYIKDFYFSTDYIEPKTKSNEMHQL